MKDATGKASNVLVITDAAVVRLSEVLDAVRVVKKDGIEHIDPIIVTRADLQGQSPVESSSMDNVVLICKLSELPGDDLIKGMSSILKPGGAILLYSASKPTTELLSNSNGERKLLLAGFLDVKAQDIGPAVGIIGKKPAWKIGSSFSIKKTTQTLPKIHIKDDMDLIDEDSLLTEDDLKRPQLPPVGDCEVGSTRKACKNCVCGRAEADEKVTLGLTMDQITNPQSSCGSCGLGDAFRCSTCPYKGLPKFKLGEKVALPGNFLAADI
ncbi:hypothetical protein Leryth_013221 [Lithospermum erythrorhizon]|nr:hypothetical protein Leryth_013221 [Lithospermum erythrorhizon]